MPCNDTLRGQIRKPRNRDIPLLTRVLYTMQALSATEQKRMMQQDRLFSITQKITGMPGGHGEPKGYEAAFAAICEIEEQYEGELAAYTQELKDAEGILNAIQSRTMRTFVTMRYLIHMTRKEIMDSLNLKRWRYEEMLGSIERAEDMAHVRWEEPYEEAHGDGK